MMHALSATLLSLFLIAPIGPGWLGVYIGVDDGKAVITEVMPDSPAEKAGLKAGDVLLGVGDQDTATSEDFVRALQAHAAGDRVRIKLRRGEREQVVVVRLGERPAAAGAGAPEPPAPPAAARVRRPAPAAEVERPDAPRPDSQDPAAGEAGQGFLGVSVRETDAGIVVDRVLPDGPLAGSGLESGDKITAIGDQRVRKLADLDRVLARLRPGQRITIAAAGDEATKSIRVRVGRRPDAGRTPLPRPERAEAAERAVAVEVPAEVEVAEVVEEPVREVEVVEAEPARPAPPQQRRRVRVRGEAPRGDTPRGDEPRPDRAERQQYDLQRELTELRKELAELRRMLEELRKKKDGE